MNVRGGVTPSASASQEVRPYSEKETCVGGVDAWDTTLKIAYLRGTGDSGGWILGEGLDRSDLTLRGDKWTFIRDILNLGGDKRNRLRTYGTGVICTVAAGPNAIPVSLK